MNMLKDEFLVEYSAEELNTVALPGRISDKYTVEACLKQTDEKQIYILLSKADGSRCVLKRARLSSGQSLLDEYVIFSSLRHNLIPKAIGYMEDDQYGFLIREYVPGASLFDEVERRGPFSEGRAIETIISVCEGIGYLHRQRPPVIHRDIKPQNIILTPDGECKLIDMGTSRRYKEAGGQDTVFMGTQITAAPEQFGYRQTDQRSDIYGIGILMLYLLTGSFQREDSRVVNISKPLRRIIARCLEFDPDRRYKDADMLKARLKSCIGRKKRNKRIGKTVLIAASLSVIFLGLYDYITKPDPSKTASFKSPLIEQAVRNELDKTDHEPVMRAELDGVHQLLICGDKIFNDWNRHNQYSEMHEIDGETVEKKGDISDLQDLKQLKNLQYLVLDKQNISDISALKGMPLKKLSLCENRIRDISPLGACKQLSVLKLEGNPLNDIRPLSGLEKLGILDIGHSNIDDLSAIRNLPIYELYILNTMIRDYSPLKDLPQLEQLNVRYLTPSGLSAASELRTLKRLTIYESGIDGLEYFEKLEDLENLDLNSNDLYDLSGITKLTNLRHIGLGNNRVKSLAPLAELKGLNSIDIADARISDYTPIKDMQQLIYINCTEEQAKQIDEIAGDRHFQFSIR